MAWVGMSTLVAGLAYVANRPGWLGKESLPLRVFMAPYLRFSRLVAATAQRLGHKERDEVAPGIWVGGWPRAGAPSLAQLDLTAELPRRGDAQEYACVPMLDGRGMSAGAFDRAMVQVQAWREAGHDVLIHCAYGHGRSVSVACALLVAHAPIWRGFDTLLGSVSAAVVTRQAAVQRAATQRAATQRAALQRAERWTARRAAAWRRA